MSSNITNKHQMAKLVQLMQCNPDIAKGLVQKNSRERWEAFSNILNSLGPPYKTYDRWSKVWVDLKSKTKKKLKKRRAERCETYEGENIINVLSPLEVAVDQLLDINKSLDPLEEGQSYIIEEHEEISQPFSEVKEEIEITNDASISSFEDAQTLSPVPSPPAKRRKTFRNSNLQSQRMSLLEKHSREEQKFHKEVCQKLETIGNTLNIMLRQQKEHQQRMIDLKIEEFRLIKENNANNEKYRAEKLKILKNIKK